MTHRIGDVNMEGLLPNSLPPDKDTEKHGGNSELVQHAMSHSLQGTVCFFGSA